MIDFKCRHYEVRIFPVSENGEIGLGDEGAGGAMLPPPRIRGLEPPLVLAYCYNIITVIMYKLHKLITSLAVLCVGS